MSEQKKQNRTYEQWLERVGTLVEKILGLSTEDLPDLPYADWYDEGISPARAAGKILKAAKEGL